MVVRVLVVDDQTVVRAGFAAIVDAEEDLVVVGQAGDGAEAMLLAAELEPDVVLMDIRMPGLDGLSATRLLTGLGERPRVLVLTTFDLNEYVYEALRSGASGFLLKDARPEDLLTAIRVIAAGDGMLAPAVTRRLIQAFAKGGPAVGTSEVLDKLTPRELEVLTLIAAGLSNAEIGDQLGVAVGTVKTHVNALLAKIGARDRVQATIIAYDLGLVRPRG